MTSAGQALNNVWRRYERKAKGLGKAMKEFFEIEDGDTFPNICIDMLNKHIGRERLLVYGKEKMTVWINEMMCQHDADSDWSEEISDIIESYLE